VVVANPPALPPHALEGRGKPSTLHRGIGRIQLPPPRHPPAIGLDVHGHRPSGPGSASVVEDRPSSPPHHQLKRPTSGSVAIRRANPPAERGPSPRSLVAPAARSGLSLPVTSAYTRTPANATSRGMQQTSLALGDPTRVESRLGRRTRSAASRDGSGTASDPLEPDPTSGLSFYGA
jgi:hypothetical protein